MRGIIAAAAVLCVSPAMAQTVVPSEAYTHPQRMVAVEGARRQACPC